MARNTSGRAGFTPENLTAGLDLNIEKKEKAEEEKKTTPEKKENPSKESNNVETETSSKKPEKNKRANRKTEESKVSENRTTKDDLDKSDSKAATVAQEPSSLDDLLNTTEYDKKQENIYLPPETREPLQAVGKLIGKKNGGKSTVVHMALLEFFKNNPDTVKKALEIYGKN